jgi:hypothetical protein
LDQMQFWKLIEETKAGVGGDCKEHVDRLRAKLSGLSEEEIITFAETMENMLHEAYTWELWVAAYIINGGCSDDMFEYFRLWLIAQGEQIFKRAVIDPEALADFPGELPDYALCEELGYVAEDAYEQKTGEEMPDYQMPSALARPRGRRCKEGEEDQLYPRLAIRVRNERAARKKR